MDPLPKFLGKNLENFIFTMNTYLAAKKVMDEEDRIPFLISRLEGDALTWWRGLDRDIKDWEATIFGLRLNYIDHQAQQKATSAIQALQQKESIVAFFTKIEEFTLEPKIPKENLQLTLTPNLRPKLQAALAGMILENPSYE